MNTKKELFEQMRENTEMFDERPKDQLWEMLEQRLDKKKNIKKLQFYRLMAFAAMFTAVIAALAYFNHYLTDHNPQYYVSNEGFTAYSLEELDDDNSFFNTESIISINTAYELQTTATSRSFVGEYQSMNEEISFNISIIDYVYKVGFEFEGFPTLNLTKIEGNTMTFESTGDEILKLNIEPDGMQIVDSNFLPEYLGLQFRKLSQI